MTASATFPCEQCGEIFASAAACASHKRAVHGQASLADTVANGTHCAVCGVEFWDTRRLKLHLRKSRQRLTVTEAADLGRGVEVRSQLTFAWPPAVRVAGPQPFWATRRPSSTAQSPCIGQPVLNWPSMPVSATNPDFQLLQGFAKQVVDFVLRHRLSEEDTPVSYLRPNFAAAEVARCAITAATFILARSAGSRVHGQWRVQAAGDRCIIRPHQAEQVEALPAIWQVGGSP